MTPTNTVGRLREARSADGGFTLVELIVAMAIFAIVMGALASGAIAIQRATYDVDVRTENVGSARVAMENLTRRIRAADDLDATTGAFQTTTGRDAVFYANLDNSDVPWLVRFRVDGQDRLIEETTPPTVSTTGTITHPTTNRRTRTLVANVAPGAFLTYYRINEAGNEVSATSLTDAAQRRAITRIRVDLRISRNEDRVGGQQLTTTVRIPNRNS